jgi:hypothetical protein
MTKLAKRKTRLVVEFSETVREQGRYREVTMECTEYGITVRLKGLRTRFEVSPAGVYNLAARLAVEKRRQERKAAKKEKAGR